MTIEIKTKSGKTVKVNIPYDHKALANVTVDGEII
jgi:hypothetical protein